MNNIHVKQPQISENSVNVNTNLTTFGMYTAFLPFTRLVSFCVVLKCALTWDAKFYASSLLSVRSGHRWNLRKSLLSVTM